MQDGFGVPDFGAWWTIWTAVGTAVLALVTGGLATWRGARAALRAADGARTAETMIETLVRLEQTGLTRDQAQARLQRDHDDLKRLLEDIHTAVVSIAGVVQRIEVDTARIHATVRPIRRDD